jgi:hypothetical protein
MVTETDESLAMEEVIFVAYGCLCIDEFHPEDCQSTKTFCAKHGDGIISTTVEYRNREQAA